MPLELRIPGGRGALGHGFESTAEPGTEMLTRIFHRRAVGYRLELGEQFGELPRLVGGRRLGGGVAVGTWEARHGIPSIGEKTGTCGIGAGEGVA